MIDLTGQRFGRLTVIKRDGSRDGRPVWSCRCDCGVVKLASTQGLRQRTIVSCGCKHRLSLGEASANRVFYRYKSSAKARGLLFALTRDQFVRLASAECFYCGAPPSLRREGNRCNGPYVYNGIDRKDPAQGYVMRNVVPCCFMCNFAKNTRTVAQFKAWIHRIAIKHGLGLAERKKKLR